MSQGDLIRLLKKVEQDLRTGTQGDAFRKFEADIAPHIFSVDARLVEKELRRELLASYGGTRGSATKLPETLEKIIQKEVPKFVERMYQAFSNTQFLRAYSFSQLVGDSRAFSVKVELGPGATTRSSVFVKIRNVKRRAQRPLINEINKGLRSIRREQKIDPNAFLDLGHEKGLAIERTELAFETIGEGIKDIKISQQTKEFKQIIRGLKNLGVRLNINSRWVGGTKEFIVGISLESATANRIKGSKDEKKILNDLRTHLTRTIEQYGDWATQKGSDSKVTQVQKEIIQTLDKGIRKGKYVRKNFKKDLLKEVNKKPAKVEKRKKQKARVVVWPEAVLDASLIKPDTDNKPASQDLLSLQVLLNQELPPVVRKNMVAPALVNRTGRFSESTRITDIQITKKGFPSIGYTYDKQPYQVFEMTHGRAPWANPDRDPRKIIDQSIREIAAEYLVGRFFTRRV